MEEQTQTPQTVVSFSKPSKKKPILFTLLAVVLIAGASGGTYYWQHNKYTATNKKLANANAQITSLNGQVASWQSKYNKAEATINTDNSNSSSTTTTAPAQSDLSVAVNGAQYVNPDGTTTANASWFGVNVTLTNNTKNTIAVSDSNFSLKDAQSNSYPEETIVGSTTLPSGWVALTDTSLAPGASVKGTVVFHMPNTSVKSFSFINDGKSYAVSSTN